MPSLSRPRETEIVSRYGLLVRIPRHNGVRVCLDVVFEVCQESLEVTLAGEDDQRTFFRVRGLCHFTT